jgi:hypothetical protein
MNGVLTKGEKRYFMSLIDDATKYYYVFLLKTKDDALEYFIRLRWRINWKRR